MKGQSIWEHKFKFRHFELAVISSYPRPYGSGGFGEDESYQCGEGIRLSRKESLDTCRHNMER
jgi:hypothetical protein